MEKENRLSLAKTASGLNVVLGIWLVLAPLVIYFASPAALWNEVIVGIVLFALALSRTSAFRITWPSWVNLVLGAWLIIAPFVLGDNNKSATWTQVISGLLIGIVALISISATWSAVRGRGQSQTR
jgi:VIT1/CCC1 family predicted Fe2+/Mn2+ transporter